MVGINAADLDAATRKRLGIKLPSRTRTTRKEITDEPGLPVVCHYCEEPCDGDAAQERHMGKTGHRRFRCLTP